jgi:hypothetical protein
MGRLRFATALAIVLVSLAPPFAGAGAPISNGDDVVACGVPGQVKDLKNHWLRIKGPTYAKGEGGDGISAVSVPPSLPGWIYASNGQVVQLSTDGGCHWSHLWSSGSALAGQGGETYTPDVVTHVGASKKTGLWFVTYDRSADGVAHPHVYATEDATPVADYTPKAPISTVEVGLPPVGLPVAFAVSHTRDPIGWLLLEGAPDPTTGDTRPVRRLYYTKIDHPSQQAGLPTAVTWQEVADVPAGFRHIDGMTLSPDSSQNLWVWQGDKFAQHTQLPDGTESSWTTGAEPAVSPISTIDVDEVARASIYAPGQGGGAVIHADAADKVLDRASLPVAPAVATHGSQRGVAAVSGPGGTYGYDVVAKRWIDISPGRRTFSRLHMGVSTHGDVLLGQDGGYLYRFDLYPGSRFLPPPPQPKGSDIIDPVLPHSALHGPRITVSATEVTVAPGATEPDAVDFGVPAGATPQDVYFLVDTTGSMSKAINGLKKGLRNIAAELAAKTHGTTCFGVGDVDDEYATNLTGAYTRKLPITCPDDPEYLDKTYAALNGLDGYGGGDDEAEAQTLALEQAATGAGQTTRPIVPKGQGAEWRHDQRVIVLVTDSLFKQGGGYPTINQAAAALHAYSDIKVVGVQVIDDADQVAAHDDLKEIATKTDTLAHGGIDCDGDGKADLHEGEPLVCQDFWDNAGGDTPLNLAPSIVSLLIGVRDPGTLAVTPTDAHHVIKKIDGKTSDQFNLKLESHLPFTMHLTCSAAQDGQDLPVTLVGYERAQPSAINHVLVRCRAAAVPPPPPPHVPDPPPPLRPPQPPPPPIPIEPPPPVTNNPPPNMNVNAGFSSQEEEQYQIAAVGQDAKDDEAEDEAAEYAMSAVREGDPATAPLLLGAALLTTGAAGYAFALRRRTQRSLRTARSS